MCPQIGDLDGDGVTELAVGAMGLGKQRGAVFILYLNRDGSVKKSTVISSMQGTYVGMHEPTLEGSRIGVADAHVSVSVSVGCWCAGWDHKLNVEDQFGHAVRAIGDLDGEHQGDS